METMEKKQKQTLDIEGIRRQIPMLSRKVKGKPIIHLDSAASGHKPRCVIDQLHEFYNGAYAKPDEDYTLSKVVTQKVQEVREKMARFLGGVKAKEIVFTRGCTEGINMIAGGFGKGLLKEGDEVVITALEHH